MRPFKPLIARGLITLVCFAVIATAAPGEEAAIYLHIPPQPAGAALDALASQSGLQPFYTDASVQGLESTGLLGRYTPQEAVDKLLAGTGLTYQFTGPKMVAIRKPERVAQNDAADTAPKKAPPAQPEEEIVTLPEITVTGSPTDDTSYNPPNATTATKTDTPIMETPFSIQVVPQQVFRDQQIVRIPQALRNISGVDAIGGQDAGNFIIRGFETPFIYREGVRFFTFGANPAAEVANLERIEVLKGVASMLYGRIEPGGLINLIRKKPLASPYYALEQQLGSFDFYRTTLDASGPITQDDTLLYRFNLAYEDAGSFRDFFDSERVFVAPHLRWNLSPRTQADLYIEYLHERTQRDSGIPALGNRPAPVPRERRFDEPGDDGDREFDDVRVGFHWSHAFNDRWTLRQRFDANLQERPLATSVRIFGNADPQNCTRQSCPVPRFIFETAGDGQNYQTNLDLTGKLDTWGLEHSCSWAATILTGGTSRERGDSISPHRR